MKWILIANVTVGIVVPCIVVLRKIFIYRIPGRIWLLLWKILIFRLLCPFTLKLRSKNVDISRNAAGFLRLKEKMELSGGSILLSSADELIKIAWLLGAITTAGLFIHFHLIKRRLYCMALPVTGAYFENWKKTHSLKRGIEIKESDRIAAPLTYGVIKPVILLPAHRNITKRSLEFVLGHEFIHIKHLDILLKWILVLLCSFYWYNPLIWAMYFFVNRDIELSCDEALIKHQTSEYRKEYLNVLIELEEKNAEKEILCSSFCKHPIEERIRVMIRTEKGKNKDIFLSMFIVCFITILNIGTIAKAEYVPYNGSMDGIVKANDTSGAIPNVVGMDEERAREILGQHGLTFIIIDQN